LLVPVSSRTISAALLLGLTTALVVGCSSSDPETDVPAGSASPTSVAEADPVLVREAEQICASARADLTTLGEDVELDPSLPDPVREGLVRPGARIYARQGELFRELTNRIEPTPAVSTYIGYFEIIDTLLNARLRVGEPGGPVKAEAQPLEARFQAVAGEQSAAATAAGLPGCAYEVTDAIFGS
jgi:hypothetical protein